MASNKKGFFVVGIAIMLVLAVVGALFFFGTKIIIEKRSFQEKILQEGNRLETTGKMIQMAGDLATLQTVKDIGQISVTKTNSIEFNLVERLPYWKSVPRDEIKQNIADLSKSYFKNYFNDYIKFFSDRSRSKYWSLDWNEKNAVGVFELQEISVDLGSVTITYDESPFKISKEFSIKTHLKTNFAEILNVAEKVINKINSGEDLNEIKGELENDRIAIELTDRLDYVKVVISEKGKYWLYDSETNSRTESVIGVKFLVEKIATGSKYKPEDLPSVVKCSNDFVIMSNNDICSIVSPN